MPRPSKSIIEQATAEVAEAEYRHITRGLSDSEKTKRVEYALRELQKLRGDRRLPDYRDAAVSLFYTLWYLPSQVNLASALIEEMMPFGGDIHIVDFGAGPGALALGAAMAVARRRQTKVEPKVTVHEVDCRAMRNLSSRIWNNYRLITSRDGNRGCQRAANAIEKRTYATAEDVVNTFVVDVPRDAAKALTALHVIYRDNQRAVEKALSTLWENTQPARAFVTTPNVGSKLEIARAVVPFQGTPRAMSGLPIHGRCSQLTDLRREIRTEFPFKWSHGRLLWPAVTWEFEEGRTPYVLRYPDANGGAS